MLARVMFVTGSSTRLGLGRGQVRTAPDVPATLPGQSWLVRLVGLALDGADRRPGRSGDGRAL